MTASSEAPQRAALTGRFTAPGQPFELGERTVRGAPLPRTQSGKALKRDLRSAIAAELRDG